VGLVLFAVLMILLIDIPATVWGVTKAYKQIKEKDYDDMLYALYVMVILSIAQMVMFIYYIYMYIYTGSM